MGTLGVKLEYNLAVKSANDMIEEIKKVCCTYDIDNVVISGSVLRKKPFDIGDIDLILVTTSGDIDPNFSSYLSNELGFSIDASGSKIVRAISYSKIQFDFYGCSEEELPTMRAYLTGPDTFNIGMRSKARELGLRLNQKSLIDLSTGSAIQLNSEKELFNKLNCNYINPEDRINWYSDYKKYKLE